MGLNLQKYRTNIKRDPNKRILIAKSSISGSAGRINGSAIMESINIFDLHVLNGRKRKRERKIDACVEL